jgi:hypothetical protein
MNAYKNKNLLVPENIVLTTELDFALCAIDKYWPPASETVTSAVRTPDDQIRIIRQYLRKKGLQVFYPQAMTCELDDLITKDGKQIYAWQEGWSALLNAGIIVNPPYEAECLMDYFRNGVNKKGHWIGQSPHVKKKAFDLSGTDSLTIVKRLVEDKMIRGYLVERENNCIHVDI